MPLVMFFVPLGPLVLVLLGPLILVLLGPINFSSAETLNLHLNVIRPYAFSSTGNFNFGSAENLKF